jgi:hypothetical protein
MRLTLAGAVSRQEDAATSIRPASIKIAPGARMLACCVGMSDIDGAAFVALREARQREESQVQASDENNALGSVPYAHRSTLRDGVPIRRVLLQKFWNE